MNIPPLLVLTDRSQTAGRPLMEVIAAAVDGGARAVVLREKDLPDRGRAQLAGALRCLLAPVDGTLLVASGPAGPGDGLHLAASDAMPGARPALVGRSCHARAELDRAAAEGCTYATLSPVFITDSKPGYGPPLTPEALRDAPLPVVALGGVTAATAAACLEAGASGIAVMGAVMRALDPAVAAADILAALSTRTAP